MTYLTEILKILPSLHEDPISIETIILLLDCSSSKTIHIINAIKKGITDGKIQKLEINSQSENKKKRLFLDYTYRRL